MFETGGNTHNLTTVFNESQRLVHLLTMDFNPWT